MRILLVEDNRDILANLADYLGLKGYTVDCAQDGLSGLHLAATEHYDLIVLDIMLPGIDGYTLCKRLREDARRDTPVIMLTARDQLDDRLQGFKSGADDYLIKPFDLAELKARLRALLRRSAGRARVLIEHAGICLDPSTQQVSYHHQPVSLTPKEYQLLHELLSPPGRVMTRDQLIQLLYGWNEEAESNTLEVHIHHLRKKFSSELIRTVRGVGYLVEERQ